MSRRPLDLRRKALKMNATLTSPQLHKAHQTASPPQVQASKSAIVPPQHTIHAELLEPLLPHFAMMRQILSKIQALENDPAAMQVPEVTIPHLLELKNMTAIIRNYVVLYVKVIAAEEGEQEGIKREFDDTVAAAVFAAKAIRDNAKKREQGV